MSRKTDSQTIKSPTEILEILRGNPTDPHVHIMCSRHLSGLSFIDWKDNRESRDHVYEILILLLQKDYTSFRAVTFVGTEIVKTCFNIGPQTDAEGNEELLEKLAQDRLFPLLLEKTINIDFEYENFLVKLRRHLLFIYAKTGAMPNQILPIAIGMAHQCFQNEYIYPESDNETEAVKTVKARLADGLQKSNIKEIEVAFIVIGMYRFIHKTDRAKEIMEIPPADFTGPFWKLVRLMIYGPAEEERLKLKMPSFGKIVCDTSLAVGGQYEESPYPRWISVGRVCKPLEKELGKITGPPAWLNEKEGQSILIAGSGTGRHPLSVALGNPNSEVWAVDISKASLAYGMRKAREMGVNNIRFLYGDLLQIASLGIKFHYISAAGVLHHMKNPVDGWVALKEVLMPEGILHIGIYGKVARLPVSFFRNEIKSLGVSESREDIKAFRQKVMMDPIKRKLIGPVNDIFTVSGARDLLFHRSEYQFRLAEIRGIIEKLDMRFLGFRVRGKLKKKYLSMFPDDPGMKSMENWLAFEKYYTGSVSMYTFFVQKKAFCVKVPNTI